MADALGPDVTCIHCPNLKDEELRLLAEGGAGVSISAPIEMQMGHGEPPIQRARAHGIRPILSVDVETQMGSDLFTQMRVFFARQRIQVLSGREGDPEDTGALLTVRDVVDLATRQGARDNGLEDEIGSLTPGKAADIVLLTTEEMNVMPVGDPYGAVVLGMDTSNVESVLVAGRPRKWRGRLVDVDLADIRERARASRDRLRSEAGL